MSRIIEKSLLKSHSQGDVSRVKDIVRAMGVLPTMNAVVVAIRVLLQMETAGLVEIVRVKERFLTAPSR